MYIPKRIIIHNFLSIESIDYNFNVGQALLLQGINLTDEGTDSNGSGKSSFFSAINYSLTANSPKPTNTDLIRYNEDFAELDFYLYNTQLQKTLRIYRTIPRKGSSILRLWLKNGDVQNTDDFMDTDKIKFSSVVEGNKEVLRLIGIDQNDLNYYYLINRKRYKSFFSASDTEKKDFIGRFSNSSKILSIPPIIQQEIDGNERNIQNLNLEISKLKGREEMYQENIDNLKSFDYDSYQQELSKKQKLGLEELEEEIKEKEQEIISLQENKEHLLLERNHTAFLLEVITRQKDRLEKLSLKEKLQKGRETLLSVKEEQRVIEKELKSLKKEKDEFLENLSDIKVKLSGTITCPKCKHKFILDTKESVSELSELRKALESAIQDLELLENDYNKKILLTSKKENQFNAALEEVSQKDQRLQDLKRKTIKSMSNLEEQLNLSFDRKIAKLDQDCEFGKREVENLKTEKENLSEKTIVKGVQEKRKENKEVIKKNEQDKQECAEKINELLKKVESEKDIILHKAQWINNFKRFYTFLSNRSLNYIQGYANMFLEKMGTNLQLQLEGFKVLADGTVREKISSLLLRDGMIEGSTDMGSQGEQGRLECAVITANQTIINNSKENGGGLDLLLIDEVLDGVDSTGMENLLNSLSKLNKTIFLTTHVQPKNVVDNVLKIQKVNGVSQLVL